MSGTAHEVHDNLVLEPRDVQFDWSRLPLHWIPDEPFATHTINVLHLLLPEGERWFIRVFKEALPMIRDEQLREEVLGFIGQESIHAEAHQGVLEHLMTQGLDPRPYVRQISWLFQRVLGEKPGLSARQRRENIIERVAFVAAIEHFTAFLGDWALNSPGLDRAKADPTMLDLLRWHGAEEVEHRSVAYDLMVHLDPGYLRRVRGMLVSGPLLVHLWVRGVRFLLAADPTLDGRIRPSWREAHATARRGMLPDPVRSLRSGLRYLKRGYHPTQEGSSAQALSYLATSPAARAAVAR
ncbi:putative metal-dependent hydrolase [Kitasatospora sp. MAP12-15]|uniref:metal-dependent hydrolase n=1 Tax=unclassified Kitasatospora TaxID=2633591 RepID=UPI002475E38F|nr:metal-dependent hydrolase [Kitasatospora sp. MAP12-44]MDH6114125.1 putative metal-dependent hydrolase [Kitasatospora sp. MAP12-44]